ncbi:ATP-dependent Clp protease proteolytic subunit [Klebsiella pasteurii]|uniref:ClpP-like prohead protease/major capsid protein fusion protein n=1 Tax=Klebsiella pasteurii TaxID=2587529 RepID=UPI00115A0901|nr:ClpP-like prohead protease/major capsid protein fusion protein [Klebsiella pasteurii]VUS29720.1 ATP-dependent Clp protease proteolytic subunit [Klebsiella pasteurii]
MNEPQKAGFIPPRASVGGEPGAPQGNKSWFSVKASQKPAEAVIDIYDEIGFWGISAQQFKQDLDALGELKNITLHINSPGGNVGDGVAIFNLLRGTGAYITVHIDGIAASMASVIAMVGHKVIMPGNTMMMIHKPWGSAAGNADEMREYADFLDKWEGLLLTAYTTKTGKSAEEIAVMLADETWLTATECVELGFADEISDPLSAMACIYSQKLKDYSKMPNDIRNSITPPRNSVTQPPAPNPAPVQQPAPANADPAAFQNAFMQQQQARASGIREVFAQFPQHVNLEAESLADLNCSVDQARQKLLTALAGETTTTDTTIPPHMRRVDNGQFVTDGIKNAISARVGHCAVEASNAYNVMTLRDLARVSLTERGVSIMGMNAAQMVAAAFTHSSSDFGSILLDVSHKSMMLGWDNSPETYERWTKKGTLTDFKPSNRVGMGGFDALEKVDEGAEYKYITTGDKKATIALATYGNLFSITRQAIINDDLGALTDIPRKMGMAAKATIGNLVYALLTGNVKMPDEIPLFDKRHGNIVTGPFNVDTISQAEQLMLLQQDDEQPLNITPAFMLVPVQLKSKARQVIGSDSVAGADVNSGVLNPIKDFAEVISEARLSKHSKDNWYLTAAQGTDTIEVAYLDGIDTPYFDQQDGFTTDGVATKIRIDAGVSALDYRGFVRGSLK